MAKRKPVTLNRIFVYISVYVIILCFSVYQYYYGYYLLESGVVLQDAVIASVLCVVITAFLFWRKIKAFIDQENVNGWRNYVVAVPLAILSAALLCPLLVGCIAVTNSSIGPQHHIVLNAILVDANRETGRRGVNEQFYYKFCHFDTSGVYKNYVLRSPNKIYFEKKVHLELTKGCLGILYQKE